MNYDVIIILLLFNSVHKQYFCVQFTFYVFFCEIEDLIVHVNEIGVMLAKV